MTRTLTLLGLFLATVAMTGCEAIGTIFEAGIWVGVIIVAIVLGLIFLLIRMMGGRR